MVATSAPRARPYASAPTATVVPPTAISTRATSRAVSDSLQGGPARRRGFGAALLALALLLASATGGGASDAGTGWSPGNGVVLPWGFWVAGDVTAATEILEDDDSAFAIDDVSLLARWDATSRFALFTEVRLDDLWEVVEGEGSTSGDADVTVERLYAEVLLTPHLTARIGKFYTPFGLWNEIRRAPLTWTVERPAVTENVFPQHATGLALLYQTTWQGWSFDATAYGPAQDELKFRQADEDDLAEDGLLFGGRVAAGRTVGPVYAALGMNAAGFRPHDRDRWATVLGPDLLVAVGGHEISGELTFRVPEHGRHVLQGLYLQDVIPLTPLLRVPDLYGVLRFEQLEPGPGPGAVGGLVGLFWRPTPMVVLRANYFFTSRTVGEFEPGFLGSLSVLF